MGHTKRLFLFLIYRLVRFAKTYLISIDFILSLLASALLWRFAPNEISNNTATDVYNMGIAVLSIVFSVFFASLALISSSGDDDFVLYLDSKKVYKELISLMKFSMTSIFVALLIAIFSYINTYLLIEMELKSQSKVLMVIFIFFFMYGLLASLTVALDSMKYTNLRVSFLKKKQNSK
jgi:hypothetical protein